jgi:hypothetical protein
MTEGDWALFLLGVVVGIVFDIVLQAVWRVAKDIRAGREELIKKIRERGR